MKFRRILDGFQVDFRGFSDVSQGVFWVFSGGFPMKFQMDFRGVSGVYQIVFRMFSVPLNQILFRRYSEHKSPIVVVASPIAVDTLKI